MRIRRYQWITVLVLGLIIMLLAACGAQETPAPAPTEAPAATKAPAVTEAPAATEPPAATEEAAAPTAAPATAEAPAAPSGDEKSVIAQSAANLKNLKSYRAKVIVETAGQTVETLYELVLPDRIHLVSDLAEMIIIGHDLYMKAGDTWTKMPGGGAETETAKVGVTAEDILEARLEGSEDVDGVPCQKYVYTAKIGDAPPIEVTAWIGVEDGLPHKIVTKMEGTTVTQILYDFNGDITIEAPGAETTGAAPTRPSQATEGSQTSYDTVFPLPDDVQNFMGAGGESQVNFQTSLSLDEIVAFYRQALTEKGLTERTILTVTSDTTFSMVFDGWPNGQAIVIQGVDLGASRNVNIRFEET